MPVDKNKLIRFQELDRCFSDQVNRYYIEDLITACNRALENSECKYKSISRSSIFTDIDEMTHNPKWIGAELLPKKDSTYKGRRYYRYTDPHFSIWKRDISETQLSQLQSILLMLRQFKDFPQYDAIEDIIEQLEKSYKFKLDNAEGIIAFETNENVEALSRVGTLFSNITHKQVLRLVYTPFEKEPLVYTFHPHFLKQYNRRWFVIGLSINDEGKRGRSVFPLDRITSFEQIPGEYIPSDKDLDDIFYDQLGVTITKGDPIWVTLQFTPKRFQYVLSKPIHQSHRIVSEKDCILKIYVRENKELYQNLLSFGPDLKVLGPDSVVREMKKKVDEMKDIYKSPEKLDN